MSTVEEEAAIVEDLSIMIRGKLRANAHKASWREYPTDLEYLLKRLKQEVAELEEEIDLRPLRPAKIRLECADVGALAAMIADLALQEEL